MCFCFDWLWLFVSGLEFVNYEFALCFDVFCVFLSSVVLIILLVLSFWDCEFKDSVVWWLICVFWVILGILLVWVVLYVCVFIKLCGFVIFDFCCLFIRLCLLLDVVLAMVLLFAWCDWIFICLLFGFVWIGFGFVGLLVLNMMFVCGV